MYSSFRRYHRYNIFATALVRTKTEDTPKRLSTQVSNISQGGMGLFSTYPLAHSTAVSIELSFISHDESEQKNIIEGNVASLVKDNDHYFMGIEFNAVIPHESFMKMIQQDY